MLLCFVPNVTLSREPLPLNTALKKSLLRRPFKEFARIVYIAINRFSRFSLFNQKKIKKQTTQICFFSFKIIINNSLDLLVQLLFINIMTVCKLQIVLP